MIKKTLLIPAAGKSSRFPNMKPKWLLTHPSGQLMIEKVLESCRFEDYERVVIVILEEHCKKYEADIILKQIFQDKLEIVLLEKPTSSAAETVYRAITKADITGRIVIKDSDCVVKCDKIPEDNFIVGLRVHSKSDIERLQEKSFIIKNDDNIIVDIVEKELVSNTVCLGVYSLHAEQFCEAYTSIVDNDVYKHKNELYVSHIVSYLIVCEEVVFEYVEATDFIDWGTKTEWYKELDKHRTYIFDIDGVLLYNCGKYGTKNWETYFDPITENIEVLKNISDSGCEIIFMTARPEEYLEEFRNFLEREDIKYKTIISGCNHGRRIIVNDFAPTNPYPSCESVSIKRNDFLGGYLT